MRELRFSSNQEVGKLTCVLEMRKKFLSMREIRYTIPQQYKLTFCSRKGILSPFRGVA